MPAWRLLPATGDGRYDEVIERILHNVVVTRGRRQVPGGDIVVCRAFAVGEEVRLELPARPRFTAADPRIDATRGCVAVERGPLVCCAGALADRRTAPLRLVPCHRWARRGPSTMRVRLPTA
ncbi:hypothetical protein ACWEFJ_21845 [Actinosynnema sp. NPDC004786]